MQKNYQVQQNKKNNVRSTWLHSKSCTLFDSGGGGIELFMSAGLPNRTLTGLLIPGNGVLLTMPCCFIVANFICCFTCTSTDGYWGSIILCAGFVLLKLVFEI